MITGLRLRNHLFDQYKAYCNFSGQPGVGDRFFLHLHRRQADTSRVWKVDIHPDGEGSFHEVPPCLAEFDRADHLFVATVVAGECRSVIVNCADSDWRKADEERGQVGVKVVELCTDHGEEE